jgi:16S rRNA (guanine527-N7)-methyltransferase
MILAIVFEDTNFTLIDSTSKKIEFLKRFIEEYKIKNVKLLDSRVEEVENLGADLVISRGVAKVPKLLELTYHLLEKDGEIILYKGRNVEDELCEKIRGDIPSLGLQYKGTINYDLDSETKRALVIYKKK